MNGICREPKRPKRLGFEDETPQERKSRERLEKLTKDGNRFAILQQKYSETGLTANVEALLKKQCSHGFKTPFGGMIKLALSVTADNVDGYEIRQKICPLCGKVLEHTVKKIKED